MQVTKLISMKVTSDVILTEFKETQYQRQALTVLQLSRSWLIGEGAEWIVANGNPQKKAQCGR